MFRKISDEDRHWETIVEDYEAAPANDISQRRQKDKKKDENLKALYELFGETQPLDYLKRIARYL